MNETPTPRVFVDACWLQHGFQWMLKKSTLQAAWGPRTIYIPTESWVPLQFEGKFLSDEAPLLAQIASLAEGGRLSLFTSELVIFEVFGGPGTSLPTRPGHVFEHVAPERIESGFAYSIVFDGRRTVREQLRTIFERYPDKELTTLRRHLGPRNLMDAVHLLTASRHNMDFYLCDGSFTKTYRSGKDSARTWPLVPSELLRNLHERQ